MVVADTIRFKNGAYIEVDKASETNKIRFSTIGTLLPR